MPISTSFWGGVQTSDKYQVLVSGDTPLSPLQDLTGHALTGFNSETSEAVDYNMVMLEGNRIVNRMIRVKPVEMNAITFTLGMGGYLYSEMRRRLDQNPKCPMLLYARRLCSENPSAGHTYIWEDVSFGPVTRTDDFIPIDGSANVVQWQTEAHSSREVILWALTGSVLSDLTPPLYAVTFVPEDCDDCSFETPYQIFYATGGTGATADPMIVYRTQNRFTSVSTLTTPAPNGTVGMSVWAQGERVMVGFSDDSDPNVAATGGVVFSENNGSTWSIDVGITEAVFGVGRFNNLFVAIGGSSTGGRFWHSANGVNWTTLSSSAVSSAPILRAIAFDYSEHVAWIVGNSGTLLRVTPNGSSFTVTDVSSSLPGTPGHLHAVAVLGQRRVAVGGASGYYAESYDGGLTWHQLAIPGSGAVTSISGNGHRTVVTVGTTFAFRDADSDNAFKIKPLANGAALAGTIRGTAHPTDHHQNSFNYFCFVTGSGEIGLFKPNYPKA